MSNSQAVFAAAVGYSVGALALLALADVAPRAATGIVLLLILTVLFVHSSQVADLLTAGVNGLTTLTGKSQSQ